MSKAAENDKLSERDIDDLLELFCKLKATYSRKLPDRKNRLWKKNLAKAKSKLAEELERHSKMILIRSNPKAKRKSQTDKKLDGQVKRRVEAMAEKEYYKKDADYAKALDARNNEISDLLKQIDHLLVYIRGPLLSYPRANKSLLVVDFKEHFRNGGIRHVNRDWFISSVDEAIDVLESVKFGLRRRQSSQHGGGKDDKAKTKKTKPPKGYIGSKAIVNEEPYKIPRSTLQGWAEQDEIIPKKNPQTGENYYKISWLEKKMKTYQKRK